LLLAIPQDWEVHQAPHDYFRYTRYGIEHLLRQAGMEPLRIQPAGGYFRLVSRRLLNAVATNDTVSRPGGDEFTVLLDGVGHASEVWNSGIDDGLCRQTRTRETCRRDDSFQAVQYRRLAGAAAERETVAAGGCIALRSSVMECCARNHMAKGSEYGL